MKLSDKSVKNNEKNMHPQDIVASNVISTPNFDEIALGKMDSKKLEEEISSLIASGHMFKAHDLARRAFQAIPDNIIIRQCYSLVLLKTGAVNDSRKLIYPLLGITDSVEDASGNLKIIEVDEIRKSKFFENGNPDVIATIGHIFKEAWNFSHSCHDLDIARELYLSSFKLSKKTDTGINAAWLSWLTGEDEQAKILATEVLKLLPTLGLEAEFHQLINLAEAQLLLGRQDDACRLYEEAMKIGKEDYIQIVKARQQLQFLKNAGFKVPDNLVNALIPPTVVVFTGHSIDYPNFAVPIFPPELEAVVEAAIEEKLDSIDAKIGYSSASCGADLLFIEALLKRGGEVNIVLPFAIADFLEVNVRHAGPRWEKRFEKAIERAHTLSLSAEDKYLGHDMLYRFSNHVMHGSAVMRARFLTTEPHLVAVWHSRTEPIPGGPTDFIDRWTDISTLNLIDLDELNTNSNTELTPAITKDRVISFDPFVSNSPDRVIKSMMFSDLSGYSKLQDEHIPAFLDFLTRLQQSIEKIGVDIEAINTWGDAVFAVAGSAVTIANFGLQYCDIVENLGKKYPEFPFPIRARISLHSGPVFVAEDPFIKKVNFYGGHINRAARLEPVTTVGQVYATQQFVSLLHVETSGEKNEFDQKGLNYCEHFATEYVGVITLAKGFGKQEVYHLRWKYK